MKSNILEAVFKENDITELKYKFNGDETGHDPIFIITDKFGENELFVGNSFECGYFVNGYLQASSQVKEVPMGPQADGSEIISIHIPATAVKTYKVANKVFDAVVSAGKKVISVVSPYVTTVYENIRALWIMPMPTYSYAQNVDDAMVHFIENCEYKGSSEYRAMFLDPETNKTYKVWTANAMYSYASSCEVGRYNDVWDNKRPSRRSCVRMRDLIRNAEKAGEKSGRGSLL